jgi:hypothetical protein
MVSVMLSRLALALVVAFDLIVPLLSLTSMADVVTLVY